MNEFNDKLNSIISNLGHFARKCLFGVLSVGSIPDHIAFIMDGNRRYAKRYNLDEGAGHKSGDMALMSMLKYCYELNIKYVTIYAFSIENFKRCPEEVQSLMELLLDKIGKVIKEESFVNHYGIKLLFVGDLMLLDESVRLAAERAMSVTSGNSRTVLSVCIAYTCTNEIVYGVQQSCREKWDQFKKDDVNCISLEDIEKHMYMKGAPDPDIVIRTSGETRLSNFLLWQSAGSLLYSPSVLWPQIGLSHLVWAILDFQRNHTYLEKKKKQLLECTQIESS